jgi:uncharacterized protein (TIGR02996 family)
MSDEKALLGAIWGHPHEDAPRLMYADWLEEHGQAERAEFIRVQCELAQLGVWDDTDRVEQLRARETELWRLHRKAWIASLPKSLHHTTFRRGFIWPHRQRHPGAKFLKLRARAFEAAPLWDVSLTGLYRNFDKVFASSLLGRVGTLMIDLARYPHDALAKLAGNDRLRNVEDLDLMNMRAAKPESVTSFFDSVATSAITRVRFEVSGAAVAALAETRAASRLRTLDLDLTDGEPVEGPPFSAARFPRLRSLGVGGGGSAALFTTPDTPLRRLELRWCRSEDVERLAAWPGLVNLRRLVLEGSGPEEAGYRALARSPFAGNLKHLKMDGFWLRDLPKAKAELDARFGSVIHYT